MKRLVPLFLAWCLACDDVDALGRCSRDACACNFIENSGFETGTSGWMSSYTVTREPGGQGDSGFAAQICNESGATVEYYGLHDDPDAVELPREGEVYRLEAWVRTDWAATLRVSANLREVGLSGFIDSAAGDIVANDDWQRVSTEYTVMRPDSTSVEAYLVAHDGPAGSCFQLDNICVVRVP